MKDFSYKLMKHQSMLLIPIEFLWVVVTEIAWYAAIGSPNDDVRAVVWGAEAIRRKIQTNIGPIALELGFVRVGLVGVRVLFPYQMRYWLSSVVALNGTCRIEGASGVARSLLEQLLFWVIHHQHSFNEPVPRRFKEIHQGVSWGRYSFHVSNEWLPLVFSGEDSFAFRLHLEWWPVLLDRSVRTGSDVRPHTL